MIKRLKEGKYKHAVEVRDDIDRPNVRDSLMKKIMKLIHSLYVKYHSVS